MAGIYRGLLVLIPGDVKEERNASFCTVEVQTAALGGNTGLQNYTVPQLRRPQSAIPFFLSFGGVLSVSNCHGSPKLNIKRVTFILADKRS